LVIKRGLIDSPLFLCYYGIIMRTINPKIKPVIRKVRNRLHHDEIYYTYSHWELNEIDGIQFIPVVKTIPDSKKNQVIHYMKKDNMEFIK